MSGGIVKFILIDIKPDKFSCYLSITGIKKDNAYLPYRFEVQ